MIEVGRKGRISDEGDHVIAIPGHAPEMGSVAADGEAIPCGKLGPTCQEPARFRKKDRGFRDSRRGREEPRVLPSVQVTIPDAQRAIAVDDEPPAPREAAEKVLPVHPPGYPPLLCHSDDRGMFHDLSGRTRTIVGRDDSVCHANPRSSSAWCNLAVDQLIDHVERALPAMMREHTCSPGLCELTALAGIFE